MGVPLAHGSGDVHDLVLVAIAFVLPAVLLVVMLVVAKVRQTDETDDEPQDDG